jgi:hypothetical protein
MLVAVTAEAARLFYELWDNTRAGREYLVSNEIPDTEEKLPRSVSRDVEDTMDAIDRIGHLVEQGVLEMEFVTSLVGTELIRVGNRMNPLIEDVRTKRHDEGHLRHLVSLVGAARKAFPQYEPQYKASERRGVGLTA